jgi:uncharacterized protein (DUF58 family)
LVSSGWWVFLVLIFVVALLTRTYAMAAFTLMLLALSLVAEWWRRRALDGVTFQRRFLYRRGFPNETLEMKMEVENRKFLPTPYLRVLDAIPFAVSPEDPELYILTHIPDQGLIMGLFSLRWFERDRRAFTLMLRKRGVYRLGPPQIESGDLFGLFQITREDLVTDYLTVFPEPLDYATLQLPPGALYGDRKARRRLYEDPNQFIGVREYQPEDDFRRLHWPTTARTGELMVKVYRPVSAHVVVFCLNVLTLPHYWEGTDPDLLEYLLRVTASLVTRGLQDGYRVGLISNTCLSHADQPFRVPPSRSPRQHAQLLTALAGATPFVTSSFDRFLLAEAPRLPYGASLVIITGLMDAPTAEAVHRLRRSGRQVTMLCFSRKPPPPIPGVEVIFRPYRG